MADGGDPIEQAEGLIASGQPDEAARLLAERIAAGRGGILARTTMVRALIAAGRKSDALDAGQEVVGLNPDVPQAVLALADAMFAAENLPGAILEYNRVLRAEPGMAQARLKLGRAWLEAGELVNALAQFEQVDPAEIPDVTALIARVETIRARPRSDPGYIRHLFDQFSSDYDERMLQQLHYRAPEVLRELADLVMAGRSGLTVLDLGCGTGLSGQAFADLAAAIDGIDLSPDMLARARRRKLYRNLERADFETALAGGGAGYDLVLAADAFVYIGDLAPTFEGVARRLTPEGFFLFTVEKSETAAYELGPKRRWRHSESYLRELAEKSGFEIAGFVAATPRFEQNVPVEGFAVALSLRR